MDKEKKLSKLWKMSRSSLVILYLLLSCHDNGPEISIGNISDYKVEYPVYSEDTSCLSKTFFRNTEVFISFSNTWNENVVVIKSEQVIFSDSINTNKVAGITYKGFSLKLNSNNRDSIKVYLTDKKITFTIKVTNKYK
jgi:hypothetical protein